MSWFFFLVGQGNCFRILRLPASTLFLDQGIMGLCVRRQHWPVRQNQANVQAQQGGVDQFEEDFPSWHECHSCCDSMDQKVNILAYKLCFSHSLSYFRVRKPFQVGRHCCSEKSNKTLLCHVDIVTLIPHAERRNNAIVFVLFFASAAETSNSKNIEKNKT